MKNKLELIFFSTLMFCVNSFMLTALIMGYNGIFTLATLFLDSIISFVICQAFIEAGDKNV